MLLLTCNRQNGTTATDARPPAGLLSHHITSVACQATSHKNTLVFFFLSNHKNRGDRGIGIVVGGRGESLDKMINCRINAC